MRLVIAGSGGHAESVAALIQRLQFQIECYFDPFAETSSIEEKEVLRNLDDVTLRRFDGVVVAIGNNQLRHKVVQEILTTLKEVNFPSLIDPTSSIAYGSILGIGSVVMQQASMGANSELGSFCILNTKAGIDHGCKVGNFSSISPGVIVGGNTVIEDFVTLGIGSTVVDGVHIGSNSFLGAGSLLLGDLPPQVLAYGLPAQTIEELEDFKVSKEISLELEKYRLEDKP